MPSFTLSGVLPVAMAEFSVIPYPSYIGTPRDIKNLKISGEIGAAPDTALSTFNKPSFFLKDLKARI